MTLLADQSPPAAVSAPPARAGRMSALVALTTLLTVELLRAFPALVAIRVQDTSDRLPFGVQAVVLVAPFLTAAAVLQLLGRLGPRRMLLIGGLLLAVARVGAQLVHGDLGAMIAGAGLLGGLVVLGMLALIGLPLFGGGVLAGVGLAAALRVALGSRDLIWIDHTAALVTVAVSVGWFLLLLALRVRRPVALLGRHRRGSVPLLVLGPALLLEAFVLTNLGWVAPALDRGWLAASVVIAVATAVGVAAAAWTAAAPSGWSRGLGPLAAVAVILLAPAHVRPGLVWAPAIVVAQAGLAGLLTAASRRAAGTGRLRYPLGALSLAPLLLLAAVVALDGRGVLGTTTSPVAVVTASGVLLLIGGTAAWLLPSPPPHHPGWRHVPSLAAVFVLPAVLLFAGLPLLVRAGGVGSVGDARELRVVTYNVQLGFTDGGALNLEEVAAVLGGLQPDVLALQEVPRGFLPTGGVDMIGWLQHTLGLPHVAFQPSTPGALHGNAILSRHPLRDIQGRSFIRSGTALPRGALSATVDVPQGDDVVVISSHFPPGGSPSERLARANALLALWDDRPRTVIGIDANAGPESETLSHLIDGGLRIPDSDDLTFPARRPVARIDFVLHSPDMTPVEVEVRPSRASDHLPVLTVLRPSDLL